MALRPDFAPGHNNRGNVLRELGRFGRGGRRFDRALALTPDSADVQNNRGNALLELNRPAEALADYERALALRSGLSPSPWSIAAARCAISAATTRRSASFDRALALAPELADAHWNRACCACRAATSRVDWAGYEWRWRRGSEVAARRRAAAMARRGSRRQDHPAACRAGLRRQHPDPALSAAGRRKGAKGGRVVLEVPDAVMPLIADSQHVTLVRRGAPLPVLRRALSADEPAARLRHQARRPFRPACPICACPAARQETWRGSSPHTGTPRDRPGLVGQAQPHERPQPHHRACAAGAAAVGAGRAFRQPAARISATATWPS